MANTVEHGLGFTRVVLDASTDFVWATAEITDGNNVGSLLSALYPNGWKLSFVTYYPPAVNATMILRNLTVAGTIIPGKLKAATGDTLGKPFLDRRYYKPCIDSSELTTPTAAEIWFEYEN